MTSARNGGTIGDAVGEAVSELELTEEVLVAATRVVPEASPVVMVNLLRYREVADYGGSPAPERGPVAVGASGREAYADGYLPAFGAVAAEVGVELEVLYYGQAHAALVAPPAERWDDVVLVRYPSLASFRRIVGGPAYAQQANHHRLAALADWRLLATSPLALPS